MELSKQELGTLQYQLKEITLRGDLKHEGEQYKLQDNFYCTTKVLSHMVKFLKTFLPIHGWKIIWYVIHMMRNHEIKFQK